MTDEATVPHQVRSFPVNTIVVEVLSGPKTGTVTQAPADTLSIGSGKNNDLTLTDETISRYHLEVRHERDQLVVQDLGSTNGTWLGPVRIERAVVPPGTELAIGKTQIRLRGGDAVECEVHDDDRLAGIIGRTPAMRRLMAIAKRAAKSDASLLLLGETGTGKEVFARGVHEMSPRRDGPFETVDCGSLLPTLVASELYGHEKGAFTGAERQHVGAFERANGGTLFLDEIGELPMALQASLLGALERRAFRRVGGTAPIDVDVRVICATNRDLRAEVNEGKFREDLYFRVAVLRLPIPPLRERVDDIAILVDHFLAEAGHDEPRNTLISDRTLDTLRGYRWRGNVRELKNFVEAALALGEAPSLDGVESPSGALTAQLSLSDLSQPYRESRDLVLEQFERLYLGALLQRTNGNVAMAARDAKMDRSYLSQLVRKHRLKD